MSVARLVFINVPLLLRIGLTLKFPEIVPDPFEVSFGRESQTLSGHLLLHDRVEMSVRDLSLRARVGSPKKKKKKSFSTWGCFAVTFILWRFPLCPPSSRKTVIRSSAYRNTSRRYCVTIVRKMARGGGGCARVRNVKRDASRAETRPSRL